ncbi:OB-fold nucleic acid binding domain-containing protein [Chloroflexota bacterium]
MFKIGSLVLAMGGLAVLLLAAIQSEVPVVRVGDLAGTMNWAYVRIEGLVARQPTYDSATESLRFWVWDGTGEVMVTAYRTETQILLTEGIIPVMGDSVAVEGTLRVREDFQYLVLDAPDRLEIRPMDPVKVSVSDVGADLLYKKVTVQGVIRNDRVPYEGLRLLTLRDATGEIDVALFPGTIAHAGDVPDLSMGQSVQVTGAVDLYKGQPQISVGRAGDLEKLDEDITVASPCRVGDLSARDVGSLAAVEGTIVEVTPFSAGLKCTLDDGSGLVTLLLWQDLYAVLPDPGALAAGAIVRVQGDLSEYRGELEVIPQIPSDVTVLASSYGTAAQRQLGELGSDDVGQQVKVEGVLRSLTSFSAGVKGILDDGTGTVALLLWQEVYDGLPDLSHLVPGAILQVQGKVSEYRGSLEVIPGAPADVVVAGMADLPVEELAVGQLTGDDVGQVVHLAGQITEVLPFSKGMQVTLDDGTGTITMLLWQNLHERLATPDLLVEGAYLSAQGKIAEYQGLLEIVPQVPADVEVTLLAGMATDTPLPDSPPVTVPVDGSEAPSESPATITATITAPTEQPLRIVTPSPTPSPEVRAIGAISSTDVGIFLSIGQAGIADRSFFSKGVKYTLTDGTGSIILLLWQNVLEEIPTRYDLVPGNRVQVVGEIEEYAGDLEIIIEKGSDVQLLGPVETLPIEKRLINGVTPADEGRIFVVEGVVQKIESNSWLRVWLDDGSGGILIFVPERTVPYLPLGIDLGVWLQVTGEVDIYKGELEIIPLAGADVKVR